MNALMARRRKSEVLPMMNLHHEARSTAVTQGSGDNVGPARQRLSKMTTIVRSSIIVPAQPAIGEESAALASSAAMELPTTADSGTTAGAPLSAKKVALFNSAARSVISQRQQEQQQPSSTPKEGVMGSGGEVRPANLVVHDPWSAVLQKVAKEIGATSQATTVSRPQQSSESQSSRISLAHVLKSHGVKNLVKQAAVANKWSKSTGQQPPSEARSAVMEHWVKTSMLRNQTDFDDDEHDDNDEDDDESLGIKSGFDLRESRTKKMYGRTLLLEESCRRAFAQNGENRSQMDLQALKAWFQMTKLKITTDFERLQPAELDLLCRRMTLASFHPKEVMFRQGDEGDALYLVFSGVVEVRVSQRVLGEKVEVTVCELSKGDYFGERSLLNNDVRAATVIAKTTTDLVRISRKDYNIMLKKDQMEFLSRMQMANGMVIPKSVQQSQREYIKVLTKKKNARTKTDIDMLSEYLQTLKFFRALPKTFVRELCTVVDFLKLPAGSPVFKEGEVGDLFYIIFTGSVDVIVSSKDFRGNAQQTKLINLTEGSHFGELALMKGHGIRSATVMTREECKFLVICEKDYNSTLRRMQKEDLSKRVGVLDHIPIFQTPEWTGELLKEMSYVLSEQKLPVGSVLFQQGDKALQVFFIVRGELIMTKEIVDPGTQVTHATFVERIGRYRVVGDDAAAGTTFNEIIFREVTVTASTPVEVLILSKYDVFHRLSRAAREALRSAARSHSESVVYLDRFHKTEKWGAYKQKVLREYMNRERLAKILPKTSRSATNSNAADDRKKKKATARKMKKNEEPDVADPPDGSVLAISTSFPADGNQAEVHHHLLGVSETQEDINTLVTQKGVLVDANEFILLTPHEQVVGKTSSSTTHTIGHFVSTFNADAPPSVARKKQLEGVLVAERRRQVEALNEGNPLVYFDLQEIKQQEKKHHAEARGRAASTRRTLLIGAATLNGSNGGGMNSSPSPASASSFVSSFDSPLPSSPMVTRTALVDKVATTVMNQFGHENFIFSRPARPDDDPFHRSNTSYRRHNYHNGGRGDNELLPDSRKTSLALKEQAEQLCDGDFVVISVKMPFNNGEAELEDDRRNVRSMQSPLVRVLQAVSSPTQAREIALQAQTKDAIALHGPTSKFDEHSGPAYYIMPKKKYAIVPRTRDRPTKATEEQLQRDLWEKFARSATAMSPPGSAASAVSSRHSQGKRPSVPSSLYSAFSNFPERVISTAPSSFQAAPACPAEAPDLFSSFQKIVFTAAEQRELVASAQEAAEKTTQSSLLSSTGTSDEKSKPPDDPLADLTPALAEPAAAPRFFAVVSMILSKHEVENSVCDEPFLCVHQLFASEMQAMDAALTMTPQHFRNALLCILPAGELVHFEDAYNWCIQVEPDRREKRMSSQSAVVSPNRNSNNNSSKTPRAHGGISSKGTFSGAGSLGLRINTASSPLSNLSSNSSSDLVPEWQVEREKAHRLHQFICSRLGQKVTMDKDRREQEAMGFTPKPLLTLDEKLSTLHEYLESSNAAAVGLRGGGGGAHALGKYRQMKKFGSIMKARLNSTLGSSGVC